MGGATWSAAQSLLNRLRSTRTDLRRRTSARRESLRRLPSHHAPQQLPHRARLDVYDAGLDALDVKGSWTAPHVTAELTSEDYRTGQDPALKAALGYTRRRRWADSLVETVSATDPSRAVEPLRRLEGRSPPRLDRSGAAAQPRRLIACSAEKALRRGDPDLPALRRRRRRSRPKRLRQPRRGPSRRSGTKGARSAPMRRPSRSTRSWIRPATRWRSCARPERPKGRSSRLPASNPASPRRRSTPARPGRRARWP